MITPLQSAQGAFYSAGNSLVCQCLHIVTATKKIS